MVERDNHRRSNTRLVRRQVTLVITTREQLKNQCGNGSSLGLSMKPTTATATATAGNKADRVTVKGTASETRGSMHLN
ncbi:tyrosine-protein kinase ABL1 [Corchorus capsularis]|uniref:Tyrosine-protein kinase ABL1 n=1 Tax=Corchorus capsularis TaxID=210143 RepID=A0A1R3JPB3_COCAP|nr:tyrosine-protein kinase ABL1 [Corchorus capsularis]